MEIHRNKIRGRLLKRNERRIIYKEFGLVPFCLTPTKIKQVKCSIRKKSQLFYTKIKKKTKSISSFLAINPHRRYSLMFPFADRQTRLQSRLKEAPCGGIYIYFFSPFQVKSILVIPFSPSCFPFLPIVLSPVPIVIYIPCNSAL